MATSNVMLNFYGQFLCFVTKSRSTVKLQTCNFDPDFVTLVCSRSYKSGYKVVTSDEKGIKAMYCEVKNL